MNKFSVIIFLLLTVVANSQNESFDLINDLTTSTSFSIETPIASNGFVQNGDLRWYHNSEQTIVDNFMVNISAYNGSGFAYLNSGMDGYEGFDSVQLILNNIDLTALSSPYLSFYHIHPDGSEVLKVYVNGQLVHTISANANVWTQNIIDLSSFSSLNAAQIVFEGSDPEFNSRQVGIGIDNLRVYSETNMQYTSAQSQTTSCRLNPGFENQQVLKVTVTTEGSLTPLTLEHLVFSNSLDNGCSNISKVQLYNSDNFTTSHLIGTLDSSTELSFSVSEQLMNGTNTFWLTVNLNAGATIGDTLDFDLTSLTVSGSDYTNITNDSGVATINWSGYFAVENLNSSGAGSLAQALTQANSYNATGCNAPAVIDLRQLSGTITHANSTNHSNDNTSILILGPTDKSLIINGSNGRLIYSYGDASVEVSGLSFTNFNDEIIYKPNSKGSLSLKNCNFYGNSGQIFYVPNSSVSSEEIVFSVENSSFWNNTISSDNIMIYIPNFSGFVSLKNVTFFNNTTTDGLFYIVGSGKLLIENSTFLNNTATNHAGTIRGFLDTTIIKNSIFDSNTPYDLKLTGTTSLYNTFISNSSQISSPTTQNLFSGNSGLESSIFADANNVQVVRLTSASSLINAGTTDALSKDQRGYYRNGNADIGAYEFDGIIDSQPPTVPSALNSAQYELCAGDNLHELLVPTQGISDTNSEVRATHDVCLPIDSSTDTIEVTWTFYDENNNSVSRTQTVNIICSTLTTHEAFKPIEFYPNPTSQKIHITTPFHKALLYDITGRVIITTNSQTINLSQLSNNIYILQIKDFNGINIGTAKIIKK